MLLFTSRTKESSGFAEDKSVKNMISTLASFKSQERAYILGIIIGIYPPIIAATNDKLEAEYQWRHLHASNFRKALQPIKDSLPLSVEMVLEVGKNLFVKRHLEVHKGHACWFCLGNILSEYEYLKASPDDNYDWKAYRAIDETIRLINTVDFKGTPKSTVINNVYELRKIIVNRINQVANESNAFIKANDWIAIVIKSLRVEARIENNADMEHADPSELATFFKSLLETKTYSIFPTSTVFKDNNTIDDSFVNLSNRIVDVLTNFKVILVDKEDKTNEAKISNDRIPLSNSKLSYLESQ